MLYLDNYKYVLYGQTLMKTKCIYVDTNAMTKLI